jgi:nitrate reductase beta subunit
LGVLLYDADRIEAAACRPDTELVDAQREIILNPFDPAVIAQAKEDGIDDKMLESAQRSPVYKFVKEWQIALPLHPEFRTLPMLFYVPPLLPVSGSMHDEIYDSAADFFSSVENSRLPMRYMASLFSAGNVDMVTRVYRKLIATRVYKRGQTVGDVPPDRVEAVLKEAEITPEEIEATYYLTAIAGFDERFVIPPFSREAAIDLVQITQARQEGGGMGFLREPRRGL